MPPKTPSPLTAANKLKNATASADTDGGWATNALATDVQTLARTILAIEAKLSPITNPITPEATTLQLQTFLVDVHELLHPNRTLRVPADMLEGNQNLNTARASRPPPTRVPGPGTTAEERAQASKPRFSTPASTGHCHCASPNLASNSTCINCKLPFTGACLRCGGNHTEVWHHEHANPPVRPSNMYGCEMALFEMCAELHSGNTQTYIDPDRRKELMDFVQWKLGHWEAPHHQSRWREFDDSVRAMCVATIRECDSTRVDGVG
jgi:hypothetical protein